MRKNVLFVTKFIPAPAYGGGLKRNLAWLKFLSKKFNVDIIGFWNKDFENSMLDDIEPYAKQIYGFHFERRKISLLKNIISSIVKREPIVNQQYYSKKLAKTIKNLCENNTYEFVFFAEIATTIYRNCINHLCYYFDDHNVEFELIQRTSKFTKFPLNLAYKRDAYLMKKKEIDALNKSKHNFFVSERDRSMFNQKIRYKSSVVNNTYEDCLLSHNMISNTPSLVFVGSLSWKPNKQGLLYFINYVYPKILEKYPTVEFNIVGSSISNEIKKFDNKMNIKIKENASEELKKKIIDQSWVCIVPVYFGSGTRIKILEYWSHAKVVVSSKIGAEGLIESKGTFIEDSDKKMIDRINDLLSDKEKTLELGTFNYKCFKENYDEERVYGNTLYNTIFTK